MNVLGYDTPYQAEHEREPKYELQSNPELQCLLDQRLDPGQESLSTISKMLSTQTPDLEIAPASLTQQRASHAF